MAITLKMKQRLADPMLKRRLAEIAAPYKVCTKKLGLQYKNYKKFSWSTKAKVRRCVGKILLKRRKQT